MGGNIWLMFARIWTFLLQIWKYLSAFRWKQSRAKQLHSPWGATFKTWRQSSDVLHCLHPKIEYARNCVFLTLLFLDKAHFLLARIGLGVPNLWDLLTRQNVCPFSHAARQCLTNFLCSSPAENAFNCSKALPLVLLNSARSQKNALRRG